MRPLATLAFAILFFLQASGQETTTRYYDDQWAETSKDKATYFADFIRDGDYYRCTTYWMKTKMVKRKFTQRDTTLGPPIGLQLIYYENGNLSDSTFLKDDKTQFAYHYFPNGKLNAVFIIDPRSGKSTTEGFDESGRKIKNFVFEKEAEFRSGQSGWTRYIIRSVTKGFLAEGTKDERVTVVIQFVVDKDGEVRDVKVRTSSGYTNVDQDALQVIQGSPAWKAAIQYNRPVKAYRIQPITYILSGKKA